MVGNPYRWRAAIPQLEHRNATAGCLLAVLLFIPFIAKTYHISFGLVGFFVAVYVSIIVPIGTGIISRKYVIGRLRRLLYLVLDEGTWNFYLVQLTYLASWLHFLFVFFDGVHVFMMQVIFNMAAEKVLCPDQRFSCLYVLLFYSFIAYLQRSLQARPWAQLLHETSAKEFIKLTTVFIIVRLGKAVILSLVLLTFTVEFNHLEPSYGFVVVTAIFFVITQYQNVPAVKTWLVDKLTALELQCLEGMEDHWVPVLTNGLAVGLSASVFLALVFHTSNYIIMVITGYVNVFVPILHSVSKAVRELAKQYAVLSKYPLATWKNPQIRAGNPCAICLSKMRLLSARCTPCGHVFHGSCLRRCLQHFTQCPLCKSDIV